MIVVKIFGGLGNQLFCYAAGRSLAERTGQELYLDLYSGFRKDFYKRSPAISHFNVRYKPAGWWRQFQFPGGIKVVGALRELARKSDRVRRYYYFERDFTHFDPDFLKQPKRNFIYLDGYWQCEKYFESIAPVIRSEFKMNDHHDSENREWAKRISDTNAVALHARRLHGVPNQKQAQPRRDIRSLSIEYYQGCMNEIADKVDMPHFYCFSDYPEWFQENLKTSHPVTFVTHNQYGEDRTHEDFWLMSLCRHFVISNSTFSWWAAWLSSYSEKMVFSPDLSFWDCKDVIPDRWIMRNGI